MNSSDTRQIVVLSGPTGSGESTITRELLKRFPRMTRLVTATTRPPRSGERPDIDYYFFSQAEFQDKQTKGEIIEVTYHLNRDVYYGTYKPDLDARLETGKVVLINTDIVGTRYYKENYQALTVFVATRSIDELIQRIRLRNPEMTEEELMNRRENAEKEVKEEQPFYDYAVFNDEGKLDQTLREVIDILHREGYTF